MTTLQHTLNLLEMCTEVYYIYMYYGDYLPQNELNDHIGDVDKIKLIYEAKTTVLLDALRNQPRKREKAENAGICLNAKILPIKKCLPPLRMIGCELFMNGKTNASSDNECPYSILPNLPFVNPALSVY